jgi:hypothetical protein
MKGNKTYLKQDEKFAVIESLEYCGFHFHVIFVTYPVTGILAILRYCDTSESRNSEIRGDVYC